MHSRTGDRLPFPVPHEAMRYSGYRAMRETAALRPDDPVGYGALGMYVLSHALWLADEMTRGGFDRLNFLSRDGWLVKQAFDLVKEAAGLPVETGYVRISRQAVFPLHFACPEDLERLPDWIDPAAHTAEMLLTLLAPLCRPDGAEALLAAQGLRMEDRVTADKLPHFLTVAKALMDVEHTKTCRQHAAAYMTPLFARKCATFDVGYNLRSESVIRQLTGADITAFITHTDSDVPYTRGVPFRTLYPASPYVSWVAREQFLLENAPLCIGYDGQGAVLSADRPKADPAIAACQAAALDFVRDMVKKHGAALLQMPLRPADGCAAFEHFLHRAGRRELLPFRGSRVENGFHAGGAGDESTFLQWRLMQTDFRASVLGEPVWLVKLRRGMIRLREEPGSFIHRVTNRLHGKM